MKISAVYKIVNTVTNDCYIGSSKNVKHRWEDHKCPSRWKEHPNSSLYKDMQKYGVDKFDFQILAQVKSEQLKEAEQQFIEKLQPTYNDRRANGLDIEKRQEYMKEYHKSEKCKEYQKEHKQSEKYKEYDQSDKGKEIHRKSSNKYNNQLCSYNGEILTLNALSKRFYRAGIEHPTQEAKKYLLNK